MGASVGPLDKASRNRELKIAQIWPASSDKNKLLSLSKIYFSVAPIAK